MAGRIEEHEPGEPCAQTQGEQTRPETAVERGHDGGEQEEEKDAALAEHRGHGEPGAERDENRRHREGDAHGLDPPS
jgi:hypothetical protein